MRLQWIRNTKGELRGVALLRGEGAVKPEVEIEPWRICATCSRTWQEIAQLLGHGAVRPVDAEAWRMCDDCHGSAAIVFCQAHAVYLCDQCLTVHTVSRRCVYLSVAAARQLHQVAG
jgi:hypothetical protein